MAIIDNQVYKLNIYDNKVSNALYKCAESEKYCKAMQKKLVFYDRDQVLDMHKDQLTKKAEYDISKLQQLVVCKENEDIERVVPLDRHWLGVFFKDKTSGQVKENKCMYISSDGDAYVTDELEPALNGYVSKDVYLLHLENDPTSYVRLHDKYFDGSHDDFLCEYYAKLRAIITRLLVAIIKDEKQKLCNRELQIKDDITLEDIRDAISLEFHKKVKSEDFETYKLLDMLYAFFHCDKIIALSDKYPVNNQSNIENHKEKE